MSNRFDFSDREVIDKIKDKINVGDYIFKNRSGSYIITTKKSASHIILCTDGDGDGDGDGTKVIIQSIDGFIKRHDNIYKYRNKRINDNITINEKSSIIVHKNDNYFLYEENIDRLLKYYKSKGKNIKIYLPENL